MPLAKFEPIRPVILREPFDDPDWIFDVKLDGFRGLAYLEDGNCGFRSKGGFGLPRFRRLGRELVEVMPGREAILDGEIVCCDETGRPIFADLMRSARPASYVPFDLLWLDGKDLRALPLIERKARLRDIMPKRSPVIGEALTVEGRGRRLFALVTEHDLEGIVAKRKYDAYGSRTNWWKIKNPQYSQREGRAELFERARLIATLFCGSSGERRVPEE